MYVRSTTGDHIQSLLDKAFRSLKATFEFSEVPQMVLSKAPNFLTVIRSLCLGKIRKAIGADIRN